MPFEALVESAPEDSAGTGSFGQHNPVLGARLEEARVAGYEYWAIGNEPGWTLQIGPRRILWETDYGQTVHEAETSEPVIDPALSSSLYRTEVDGSALVITVIDEPCSDDMSGEAFSIRAIIEFRERIYRGCGESLIDSS